MFRFISLAECHKKNFAFDQHVFGTVSSFSNCLMTTGIGSSFATTVSEYFSEVGSYAIESERKVEEETLIVF